jgi:hypothetical protein
MKLLSYFLIAAFLFMSGSLSTGLTSCSVTGNDLVGCSVSWALETQDEANAVANAAQVYNNDPSPENCDAYKDAYRAWIDALEPYGDCSALTGQQRASWEQTIQDARDDLDTLC